MGDEDDVIEKQICPLFRLKTGTVSEDDLNQIIKYENWLTRKLADGDSEMVQSILVGLRFDEKVIEYRSKKKLIEEKTVRLIKYKIDMQKNDLILSVSPRAGAACDYHSFYLQGDD